jgi:hypothetical protein
MTGRFGSPAVSLAKASLSPLEMNRWHTSDAVVLPVKFKSIPQEGHTQDVQRCGGIKISAWAPSCSTI